MGTLCSEGGCPFLVTNGFSISYHLYVLWLRPVHLLMPGIRASTETKVMLAVNIRGRGVFPPQRVKKGCGGGVSSPCPVHQGLQVFNPCNWIWGTRECYFMLGGAIPKRWGGV